jgi:NHL repeat
MARGLAQPGGVTWAGGHLLVADTDHHRLVPVDPGTGALTPLLLAGVQPPSIRGLEERPVHGARPLPLQHLEDATLASSEPEGHTFTSGAPQRIELFSAAGPDRATVHYRPTLPAPGS